MSACIEFIDKLIACSTDLEGTHKEVLAEWAPDEPPTTTLFAELGAKIAKDFCSGNRQSIRQISSLIEQAMQSDDVQLVTVVATGLIEALATKAIQANGCWQELVMHLGPRSKHHAQSWFSS
jgi:hypothetical protein